METGARRALAVALTAGRDALATGRERPRGGELALLNELLAELASNDRLPDAGAAPMAGSLVHFAGDDSDRRATLADAAARVARQLAPLGDPPASGAAAVVWQALVAAVEQLGDGPGVWLLGCLSFLHPAMLSALSEEAADALARQGPGREQWAAPPGRRLARLAVSRELRAAVSEAVGCPVVSTRKAVYLADPPGSLVPWHIDKRGYDLTLHVVLEHDVPDGVAGSALVVHRSDAAGPQRLWLRPGEAVLLRARSTVHGWGRLHSAERRTMIGAGFACCRN